MAQAITVLGDTAGTTLGMWDGTTRGTTEAGTADGTHGTTTATGIITITMQVGTADGTRSGDTTIITMVWSETSTIRTDGTAPEALPDLTACSPAVQVSEEA